MTAQHSKFTCERFDIDAVASSAISDKQGIISYKQNQIKQDLYIR